jgi:predicted negative regulator of RcsB-dependent stress response
MPPTSTDDDFDADPEALYRQLIAGDPESTLPRFSLGRLCVEKGRYAEGAELLRFCVAKTPDWAAALMLLGDALVGAGDEIGARDAYERCKAVSARQNHQSLVDEAEEKLGDLTK